MAGTKPSINPLSKPAISIALHGHQPLGYSRFEAYNRGIYERCYLANLNLNDFLGTNPSNQTEVGVSINVSGSVLLDLLAHKDDPVAGKLMEGLKTVNDKSIEKWGITQFLVQGSVFHSIMPLLPKESRELQFSWSKSLFRYFFKSDISAGEPSGVWLPEQAYDDSTLELIAEGRDSWTILPQWVAPENTDTSYPYIVKAGKRDIIAQFYDDKLSKDLSFTHVDWDFFRVIRDQNHHDRLAWTLAMDAERFGEHGRDEKERRDGPWLLNNLLYFQIPQEGYMALPLQVILAHTSRDSMRPVEIRKSGSWSCLCAADMGLLEKQLSQSGHMQSFGAYLETFPDNMDGLLRWTLPCKCTNNGHFEDNIWKLPFKAGLTIALSDMYRIYCQETDKILYDPDEALRDYIIIKAKAIDGSLAHEDMRSFLGDHARKRDNASAAKALTLMEGIYHMEAAQTSCATFWESPGRVEPGYNIIHAANATRLFDSVLPGDSRMWALRNRLEDALANSGIGCLALYRSAYESGRYGEHTHLEKMIDCL